MYTFAFKGIFTVTVISVERQTSWDWISDYIPGCVKQNQVTLRIYNHHSNFLTFKIKIISYNFSVNYFGFLEIPDLSLTHHRLEKETV